jgi:outer membrane protein OmpA-like peptidoglycan-associated protein
MMYSVVTALSLMVGTAAAANQPSNQAPPQQQPPQQQQQPSTEAAPVQEPVFEVAPANLLFDTSSAALPANSRSQLEAVATWAKCHPNGAVILEGHADIRGSQAYNMTLSTERAAAVRQKLIRLGVPGSRIVVTVYGENGPRRGSLQADRRVTVRAVEKPVPKDEITAQR